MMYEVGHRVYSIRRYPAAGWFFYGLFDQQGRALHIGKRAECLDRLWGIKEAAAIGKQGRGALNKTDGGAL